LREYISNNIESVEKGLSLYEDKDGNNGVEFPAGNWSIDVLATDVNDNYVVIELKKSRTSDRVFGQLARYMGWVKTNLCKGNQKVRGIIIGGTITEELKYAAKLYDNIKLLEYSLSVSFKDL
jgi:RecB family endonuclease NucS